MSDDLIAEALTEHWGPRCKTKDTDDFPELGGATQSRCACCLAWEQYDRLRAASEGVIDRQFAELRFNQARDEAAAELTRLRAEVERLAAALSDERAHADTLAGALTLIDEHCQNEGYGNPIVDNRIVDRCEETAREALAQHRARRQG